jgi:two-component system, OmpR family, sensor histidine kinase ChvG
MTALPRMATEPPPARSGELLLGDDWVQPEGMADASLRHGKERRGWLALKDSPLARKIVLFNLLALVVLVVGVLFLNPLRDSLVLQREQGLLNEALLVADVIEAAGATDAATMATTLERLDIASGGSVIVFDRQGVILAARSTDLRDGSSSDRSTPITDGLGAIWTLVSRPFGGADPVAAYDAEAPIRALLAQAQQGETVVTTGRGPDGAAIFSVATPVMKDGQITSVLGMASAAGEIDRLVRYEREQVLQMFLVALAVSFGLSLVLASTIANPLSDLAAAAELGRDRDGRKTAPGRVRIPDLAARPDEIGRLSVALRGMVTALYDRIDANEQFAADVAHEIKNPLASLRSAVGTLRFAKRDDQKERLLEVIEHDVRRLDRLVSDISNASRLDSELVKEDAEAFNMIKTLSNLSEYLGKQAGEKGVEFITDFPSDPVMINGLEARLAQVFVNLITNAISFCEDGDAVRVWARRRDNRVLIVVEDTGPGIPEQALTKVFKRFYSERPQGQFGNHSGLGLAISRQIVEAHGGVIWAENIRPTHADSSSDPLGARFVVGLPV